MQKSKGNCGHQVQERDNSLEGGVSCLFCRVVKDKEFYMLGFIKLKILIRKSNNEWANLLWLYRWQHEDWLAS